MKKVYPIGEFAKKTGQTIRTLHYYDEIGILKPSHVSSSGRRFYSEDEIITLQKIVALKFLGFSLDEIKRFMQEEKWDLKESLAFQKRLLLQKREHIDRIIKAVTHAQYLAEEQEKMDPDIFSLLINSIQMENQQKEWLKQFMPDEVVEKIFDISEEKQLEYEKKLLGIFEKLKEYYGKDPSDNAVQSLIEELFSIAKDVAKEVFGEYLSLFHLKEDEFAEEPMLFLSPFSKEEEEWVAKAVEIFLAKEGVDLSGEES
ncbi:MerR family transcriptional regulator [Thermaerobacillus caldiproteolyticus]|uniref:DNA-binding transcriptional MerR regulator n=1 Tax=Thermaerobacillus caldiproteolyticus TaxID=247480 RepID=A0A7W0BZH7_9BACL|nr:MerR family transcriptional regulator [Anoxybacillus caldiproteolyticus]MBA2876801.1 DNA-binding transcriptional MerR regulator [Anoxybacillus caldiproteolyticus]